MESMPFIAPTPLCKKLRTQKLQILQPQMENMVLHQKATSGSIPVAPELHSFDGNLTMPDDVTYSAMIDAYGRAGNVDMAFSLYDCARIEKWRIDPVTFSTLIKIHGQSGNFDGCLNVYEEMKAIGARTNLVIYNTLLDAMGRAKRPWQAKKIYKEMTENGFSPKLDAKIEIVLGKSKKFDSIMTAAVASELATKDKENLFHQSKFCFFVAYENGPRRTYSVHNEKTAQSDELPTNLRLSVERD
nr:pentatricopeptide repeat-containing protein At5g61990, mitochondrial-like [Ziziphus jujuba var. spinosa]